MGRSIAHLLDDRWDKEGKGIQGAVTAHVDHHPRVSFPVRQTRPDICQLEFFMLGTGLPVQLEPSDDPSAVVLGEKFGLIGEVMNL